MRMRPGYLAEGQAVFLPGQVRITTVNATLGTNAGPGAAIMQATSTRRQVVVDLDASEQTEVKVDNQVQITLLDGDATPGVVSGIGTVAGGGSNPTLPLYITLKHPKAAGTLDQAPGDPEGLLAPVQWHPQTRTSPELGPSSAELIADARASALSELDYVAAQAYAAALIAGRCLELDPDDPLGAARRLRTTIFFGAFELDPATGLQRGHTLSVVRWSRTRQELVLADAS
ncbi:MAG: hypothetical protein ACLP22_26365 [Solirubrobacteraceae bacterium]